MRVVALCLLILIATPSFGQSDRSMPAGPLLAYQGLTKSSTEQQFRKLFDSLRCKPVLGLEMLDITCAGTTHIGRISTAVTASAWKEGRNFQLYMLEFSFLQIDQGDVLAALKERYGAPQQVKAGVSQRTMDILFVEPTQYMWSFPDGFIQLKESAAGNSAHLEYSWTFTAREKSERRNKIDQGQKLEAVKVPGMRGKDF